MKFAIISPILTLLAIITSIWGQSVSQLRQCSCDDQYRGFRVWKNYVTECFDQCRITRYTELQTLLDSPVKIYPCFDQKVDMIHRMFDCVNGKLIHEESCLSNITSRIMLPYQDFRQMFDGNMQQYVSELHSALKKFDQKSPHKFGNILLGISDCSRLCISNQIQQSRFWEQLNCVPKVNEELLQQHIKTCFQDMKLKETMYTICMCSVRVGVKNLRTFCQHLRSITFPEWTEARSEGSMKGVDIQENKPLSGHVWQSSNGRNLFVKLAIQQGQPELQETEGSTRFDQNHYKTEMIESSEFL